jgi:hypothetical protein
MTIGKMGNCFIPFSVFSVPAVSKVLGRIPSEISFEWIYFPPFLFTVALGYLCAFGVTRLLNATGLSRFFWHPALAFLAIWVLLTSVIGLVFLPP